MKLKILLMLIWITSCASFDHGPKPASTGPQLDEKALKRSFIDRVR